MFDYARDELGLTLSVVDIGGGFEGFKELQGRFEKTAAVITAAMFGGCGLGSSGTGPGTDKGGGGVCSPGSPRGRGRLLGSQHRYCLPACTHMLHQPALAPCSVMLTLCRPEAGRTVLHSTPVPAVGGAA